MVMIRQQLKKIEKELKSYNKLTECFRLLSNVNGNPLHFILEIRTRILELCSTFQLFLRFPLISGNRKRLRFHFRLTC